MHKLISCEFEKLKRRHFLLLAAFAACLFPFPVTLLVTASGTTDGGFETILTILIVWIGVPLMLPAMAGIVASMLFNVERDNGTLKNLYAIPISWKQLVIAKIFVIYFLSLVFAALTFFAALIAALLTGSTITGIATKLCATLLVGSFYVAITLPAICLIIWLNRNTILSTLIAIVYAVIQDTLVWSGITTISGRGTDIDLSASQLWSLPMMIFRWFPYFISTGNSPENQPVGLAVPLWQLIIITVVISVICIGLIFWAGKRREV